GVDLARTAYLPRADVLLQENRSTRNNLSSFLLPQGVIPNISGPVLPGDSPTMRYNSAAGLFISWEPFDLGLRGARVGQAKGETLQAERARELTEFDVSVSAADTFLALLAAEEAVRSARATVGRFEIFARSIAVLAKNQLRPGVDASRAEAELARARTVLAQAEQSADVARTLLAQALGEPEAIVKPATGPLLNLPPDVSVREPSYIEHPEALLQGAAVETARARKRVADASAKPRFFLQASGSDRGSGFLPNGLPNADGGAGFGPDTPNWAVGAAVTYAIADGAERSARRKAEHANEQAEKARYEQTLQALQARHLAAVAQVKGALKVAASTPAALAAARDAQRQTAARYAQGLATVSDVSEAENLLTRAEIEDALARLGVWRGFLAEARASGDLAPWLSLTSGGGTSAAGSSTRETTSRRSAAGSERSRAMAAPGAGDERSPRSGR
ncbi:MAG: TolC family protein, partial [Candidatus Wallbacteria bacterium]|nr:TolC family protein [Candidatus Wallbacteria bacterium]